MHENPFIDVAPPINPKKRKATEPTVVGEEIRLDGENDQAFFIFQAGFVHPVHFFFRSASPQDESYVLASTSDLLLFSPLFLDFLFFWMLYFLKKNAGQDTDPISLKEFKVTLQSAQEMRAVLGQVKYFVAPKLHVVSIEGKASTIQLRLPSKRHKILGLGDTSSWVWDNFLCLLSSIRAEHRDRGLGVLGMIADSSQSKAKPVFKPKQKLASVS